MNCSKCGVENPEGALNCSNCGNVLMDIPQGQQAPAMDVVPKTSGLAITAFIMGLLSMTCILWPLLALPAIICGIVALVKISKSNGQLKGTGFAVAGLVIPAVLTVILPMFLAIMMPALSRTKMIAQRVVCGTNLKGLSTAMIVYMNDYDDQYPTPEQWCDLLMQKADVSAKSFQCPSDPEGSFSYAINENLYKVDPEKIGPRMVVLFEANLGKNGVGGPGDLVFRHEEGCQVAYVDGYVELVRPEDVANLQWTAE